MNLLDFYIPLVVIEKKYKLPTEITKYIFKEYIRDDIIIDIQNNFISNCILRQYNYMLYYKINNKVLYKGKICYYNDRNNIVTFHLCDMPYSKKTNIDKIKKIIEDIIMNEKMDLEFSHFCCSKKGVVYNIICQSNQTLQSHE